jgi:phage pi2 protein 07
MSYRPTESKSCQATIWIYYNNETGKNLSYIARHMVEPIIHDSIALIVLILPGIIPC